ncbi:MAG: hypothetical protein PHE63_11955, partial [Eubacteriales bacterium]|nr:hypothetical protein [Eubacteriales bacterium]
VGPFLGSVAEQLRCFCSEPFVENLIMQMAGHICRLSAHSDRCDTDSVQLIALFLLLLSGRCL